MHLAIYDALVESLEAKAEKLGKKAPPMKLINQLISYGKKSDYSSFICEWSAAAGAAHQNNRLLFP